MKLYSHVALIAALAAPAFCQEPAPPTPPTPAVAPVAPVLPVAPVTPEALSFSEDQIRAMKDQAKAMKDQINGYADQVYVDRDQVEALKAQIKSIASEDQIRAMKDQANIVADQLYVDRDQIEAVKAQAKSIADQVKAENFNFDDVKDFGNSFNLDNPDLKLSDLQFKLDSRNFNYSIDSAFNMAFLQDGKPMPTPMAPQAPMAPKSRLSFGRADGEYDAGTRALDQHKYDEAVQHFDAVINAKSPRSDGALYWKAYAQNRAGKRDDALAAIAQLRRDYASSPWLNDAQALETEIKQNAGQPVSPNQESNDDIKLLAINSLMNADTERAVPLVEGILKGNAAPNVKKNALFVLAQSRSPRAQQVIFDYAKGAGNPDLQLNAIQYLGMSNSREMQQQLAAIYGSVNDARAKAAIIQSLRGARAYDSLLNIAKTEKDPSLKDSAIREIAQSNSVASATLVELYGGSDTSGKRSIIDGLTSRRDAKTLIDLAKKETDASLKKSMVERIGSMKDNKEAMDYMIELVKQ
jgi:TolA-binding protein